MTYDPKKDPSSPYFADRRNQDGIVDAVRQITPGATDLSPYALDIEVQVSDSGKATIVYLPEQNADADTVTETVQSGWRAKLPVRRVVSLVAIGGGATATVFGLYDANPIEPVTFQPLSVANLTLDEMAPAGYLLGAITGKTPGSRLEIVPADNRLLLVGNDIDGWQLQVGPGETPPVNFRVALRETGDATNSPHDTQLTLTVNPISGLTYLLDDDGSYLLDDDGALLTEEV